MTLSVDGFRPGSVFRDLPDATGLLLAFLFLVGAAIAGVPEIAFHSVLDEGGEAPLPLLFECRLEAVPQVGIQRKGGPVSGPGGNRPASFVWHSFIMHRRCIMSREAQLASFLSLRGNDTPANSPVPPDPPSNFPRRNRDCAGEAW